MRKSKKYIYYKQRLTDTYNNLNFLDNYKKH